ncbi:MAG: zinc ABC transporter ATP-binding protein AztA [Anaerolineae bacterium]
MQQIAYRGTPHDPMAPPLELTHVTVGYPDGRRHHALEDITFRLEATEQVAVVGPNGAGKSTLFKLIAGILKPDQGSVAMYGNKPDQHVCIAYVPQRSTVDWSFPATVADVVMMGRTRQIGLFRRPGHRDRAIVQAALERVGAADLADKQIGELSGGQQQRAFIARALAQEAELILLDEPLSGLDVPSQEAIFEILADLRRDAVTLMVATHDLGVAVEHFDRVMLLITRLIAFERGEDVLTPENLLRAYGGHVPLPGAAPA